MLLDFSRQIQIDETGARQMPETIRSPVKCFDAESGQEITRVIRYDTVSHQLERIAVFSEAEANEMAKSGKTMRTLGRDGCWVELLSETQEIRKVYEVRKVYFVKE